MEAEIKKGELEVAVMKKIATVFHFVMISRNK